MGDNAPFPTLLMPPGIEQTDLDEAGIPAFIVHLEDERLLQMRAEATSADFQAAIALLNPDGLVPEVTDQQRIDMTNTWLSLKACLDALPPPPSEGEDPYVAARNRLQSEVDTALQSLNDAGGPG